MEQSDSSLLNKNFTSFDVAGQLLPIISNRQPKSQAFSVCLETTDWFPGLSRRQKSPALAGLEKPNNPYFFRRTTNRLTNPAKPNKTLDGSGTAATVKYSPGVLAKLNWLPLDPV
jgi:hypothetical protein